MTILPTKLGVDGLRGTALVGFGEAVAIAPGLQRARVGQALVAALESVCASLGAFEATLDCRDEVKGPARRSTCQSAR